MKSKSTFLIQVFGLVVALFACQDQGVVAPDDVISADDLVAAFGKPECPDGGTWPKCGDDGGGGDAETGTVWFWLTDGQGLRGGPETDRPIQVNSSKKLDMNGPSEAYTALASTYTSYVDGMLMPEEERVCKTAGPTGVVQGDYDALATQFWTYEDGAEGPPPVDFVNTRVPID